MATSAAALEAKELSLVGKVEMRIALADSDQKLENLLNTYLAPLLLKLGSEHRSVREKVIKICHHLKTRIAPESIKLPVAALLKQFKDHPDDRLVCYYDLIYIKQGAPRLTDAEKLDLLPALAENIARDAAPSRPNGSQIFHLFLYLLQGLKVPERGTPDDLNLRDRLRVSDADTRFLAFWLAKLILYHPSPSRTTPGLSKLEYEYLRGESEGNAWTFLGELGLNVPKLKVHVTKLLASKLFTDEERFFPALHAAACSDNNVSDTGEEVLKRTLTIVDLDDPSRVKKLFDIYLGRESPEATAVRTADQIEILNVLAKSKVAVQFSARVIEVIERVLQTSDARPGREDLKLRAAVFQFMNSLARFSSVEEIQTVAPPLIGRLVEFLDWQVDSASEDDQRGFAFEILGLLAKAESKPDLELLKWLLFNLCVDKAGKETAMSIEESLSSVISVYSRLSSSVQQDELAKILVDHASTATNAMTTIDKGMGRSTSLIRVIRSTQYVAVRFANRCLPYRNTVARWIDVLACSQTENREVHEEGEKGLDAFWHLQNSSFNSSSKSSLDSSVEFPDPAALTHDFFVNFMRKEDDMDAEVDAWTLVQTMKTNHSSVLEPAAKFCRQVSVYQHLHEQKAAPIIDADWQKKLDVTISSDEKVRAIIGEHIYGLASQSRSPPQQAFCLLSTALLIGFASSQSDSVDCGEYLLQFLALGGSFAFASQNSDQLLHLLHPRIVSNNAKVRELASHIFGLISRQIPIKEVWKYFSEYLDQAAHWQSAVGGALNTISGCILALGYYFSRKTHGSGELSTSGLADARDMFKNYVGILAEMLSATDKVLKDSCYIAMGQLCLFSVVSVERGQCGVSVAELEKVRDSTLIEKLAKDSKSGNERAIATLGYLSMILTESENPSDDDKPLKRIEDELFKLHEIRQMEAQFSVGESLSIVACGWDSKALVSAMDIENAKVPPYSRSHTVMRVLQRVIDGCKASKPSLRKASVVWLLSLVQFCGHRSEVKEKLRLCQSAFKSCLSDRDELVQEAASRGLGLVYEQGDRALKDDLVRDLVGSFSSDRSTLAGNVTEETQLFEPEALPTGDGSVTTYKDILSLASEVGDSALVYRFMSLAANNAIWSSRAAFGRFGLSSVFSDSSVDGYLAENPKLYPKLYRYRFDPNPNVQRSMNDIWKALVRDSAATLDKHFDQIMESLLQDILGKEWRVRQASCAAIGDLVQGRKLEKYDKYLGRIWTVCFKVLDDIKLSVRAAAAALARVLTGILTRNLEGGASSSKTSGAMLEHVIPFLLSTSGLESSATEVQAFALDTLLKIVKKSSAKTLRPFIPELVERMIGLLSTLEPEAINYLHLNATKYNLTEQKIDDARLSSVRASPLMEAIERCLDLLDGPSMREMVHGLENAMKMAVGLPSKVGCSRILVSLSTRHNLLFRPHADDFLKLLEKFIKDRNETVSSSYAASSGYVSRLASDKQILQLLAFCKRLYFQSDDDMHRLTSGDIISSLAKHATDRFNALAADMLPFVFLAKHDSNTQVSKVFRETWNENVGGSRAVLLYVKEIIAIASEHLDSPKWVLKHTAARTIADTVEGISSTSTGDISVANGEVIWPALDRAVGGKTWDGKEEVLKSFVTFVRKCPGLYQSRPQVWDSIKKITFREAKRQNASYRPHALRALGHVAAARTDVDLSEYVVDIVEPVLNDLLSASEDSAMDIDAGAGAKDDELRDRTLAAGAEALFDALHPSLLPAEDKRLDTVLDLAAKVRKVDATPVEAAIFSGLKSFFGRLKACKEKSGGKAPESVAECAGGLRELLYKKSQAFESLRENVRLQRAEAIKAAAQVPWPEVLDCSREQIERERSAVVRMALEEAYGLVGQVA